MSAIRGFPLHLLFLWIAVSVSFWVSGDWLLKRQPAIVLPPDDSIANLNKEVYRVFTFGQEASGVDILWLRALQEQDIRHVRAGDHPASYYLYRLISELDPAFIETYYSGATYLTVIRDDNAGALEILERGERFRQEKLPTYPQWFRDRYWPAPWRIPLVLSYVRLFEMDDLPGAAEEFRKVAAFDDAPPYTKRLVERLETPEGTFEVAIRLNSFMKAGMPDEAAKEKFRLREERLLQLRHIFAVDKEFSEYTRKKKLPRSGKSWDAFVRQRGGISRDPRGGQLRLDSSGKVVSTVEAIPVFGLGKNERSSS